MTINSSKIANLLAPQQAEQHPLLAKLKDQLRGVEVTEKFLIAGTEYTLHTLTPYEESWADGFVDGQNFYQTGRNRRAPYVAASLDAISGISIKELFKMPADMPQDTKDVLGASPVFEDDWRRREVLRWIVENVPPAVLAELWTSYQTIDGKRTESLEKIGPLSARTPSGESSLTSLLGSRS
jgi:hypothetical protein